MGTLGVQEMIVIFIVALVLFGPKKLPELGRTIGKALTEFRRASSDLKATFEREMHTLEQENESIKAATQKVTSDIQSTYNYDELPYYDSGAYGSGSADSTSTPASTQNSATSDSSTVSASEVPGAESQGTTEVASPAQAVEVAQAVERAPAVEGTVPRVETHPAPPEAPVHS
jgi:TatA/E family protein of Tat protein translocase